MFNTDTDFIFPSRVIPKLKGLRGPAWDELIRQADDAAQTDQAHLAFVLMMVKMNGCENCNADSFKAMRGCTACSVQSIERFTGSDDDLNRLYEKAETRIAGHLKSIRKQD